MRACVHIVLYCITVRPPLASVRHDPITTKDLDAPCIRSTAVNAVVGKDQLASYVRHVIPFHREAKCLDKHFREH